MTRVIVEPRILDADSRWMSVLKGRAHRYGVTVRFHDSFGSLDISMGAEGYDDTLEWIGRGLDLVVRNAEVLEHIRDASDYSSTALSSASLMANQGFPAKVDGSGVNVGVIDSGFDVAHPDLQKAVASHETVLSSTSQCALPPSSESVHGTFVAGIIAASGTTSKGIAPGARLHLISLAGGVFEDDVAQAIERLVVKHKCRVINVSLGTWKPLPWMASILARVRANGALPVLAIGNEGQGVVRWPAACESALSVGYCGIDGDISSNSSSTKLGRPNRSLVPLLVAPGVMVQSTESGGGVGTRSGSSVAAAVVSGTAALLFSAAPNATPDQVESAMLNSATPHRSYENRCAHGLLSPAKALSILTK